MKKIRMLLATLLCVGLSACPAEKTGDSTSSESAAPTQQSTASGSDAAREMYAKIMGRYALAGQCETAEFYWEFTPTTVKQGETVCQIHGLDTLMDQLSIDARQCVSEGEDSGTRLFYLSSPAPNLLQLTGSDLQQELERCGMV